MQDFISKLPKVELHLHIEGTLEPELMFDLAKKNKVALPYQNLQEVQEAYHFHNLQSFLDLYYAGASVLCEKEDFFELAWQYFCKCAKQNVRHTEIFFDPQTHTARGIALEKVIMGLNEAMQKAQEVFGISSLLIACILRHLPEEEGIKTLYDLLPYKNKIVAIGLDSSELGNPPSKFKNLFALAQKEGFKIVMHAGEEGDCSYVREALELGACRIDHGVRSEEDEALLEELIATKMPLTMCLLSNIKLGVFSSIKEHNFLRLLKRGICVTINSDDPAYFGGYIQENWQEILRVFKLSIEEIRQLSLNAVWASFLSQERKIELMQEIEEICEGFLESKT